MVKREPIKRKSLDLNDVLFVDTKSKKKATKKKTVKKKTIKKKVTEVEEQSGLDKLFQGAVTQNVQGELDLDGEEIDLGQVTPRQLREERHRELKSTRLQSDEVNTKIVNDETIMGFIPESLIDVDTDNYTVASKPDRKSVQREDNSIIDDIIDDILE